LALAAIFAALHLANKVFTDSAPNDSAGGIMVLVSKKIAEMPGMQVRFDAIIKGRALR
jgi:hypothetical protein